MRFRRSIENAFASRQDLADLVNDLATRLGPKTAKSPLTFADALLCLPVLRRPVGRVGAIRRRRPT